MNKNTRQLVLLIASVTGAVILIWWSGIFESKPVVRAEEHFIYKAGKDRKVDILWVVDNSGSMIPLQENLASNFDRFLDIFLKKNPDEIMDFRMAVITTDPLSPEQHKIHNILSKKDAIQDKQQFESTFSDMVRVGAHTDYEVHFDPVLNCFRDDIPKGRFFRNDAITVINFLTNENDNSLSKYFFESEVKGKIDQIRSYKPTNDSLKFQKVLINSIIDPEWCTHQIYASQLTNGIIATIDSDFAGTLADIGTRIEEVVNSFRLSKMVNDPGSVQVFGSNGREIDDFKFNPDDNMVELSGDFQPGEIIKIIYAFDNVYDEEIY